MSQRRLAFAASDYFSLRERSLAFAMSHQPHATFEVLRLARAMKSEIERFGTSGSAPYAQIVVRTQPTADWVEAELERAPRSKDSCDVDELRRFVSSPVDLRIVCSPTNVIHHEVMNCDICCGGHARFAVVVDALVAPSEEDEPACERAKRFAIADNRFSNADVLQVGPARTEIVEQSGTIGSAVYADVVLRLDHSTEYRANMLAFEAKQRNPNIEQLQQLLEKPRGLRVTCTATDVIRHEWLSLDLG